MSGICFSILLNVSIPDKCVLLTKLEKCGVKDNGLKLSKFYLDCLTQIVRVGSELFMSTGVPQGRVLVPLLLQCI